MDFLALLVYLEYLELKVCQDQREILVFQAILVHQEDPALMAPLDPKVRVVLKERMIC